MGIFTKKTKENIQGFKEQVKQGMQDFKEALPKGLPPENYTPVIQPVANAEIEALKKKIAELEKKKPDPISIPTQEEQEIEDIEASQEKQDWSFDDKLEMNELIRLFKMYTRRLAELESHIAKGKPEVMTETLRPRSWVEVLAEIDLLETELFKIKARLYAFNFDEPLLEKYRKEALLPLADMQNYKYITATKQELGGLLF